MMPAWGCCVPMLSASASGMCCNSLEGESITLQGLQQLRRRWQVCSGLCSAVHALHVSTYALHRNRHLSNCAEATLQVLTHPAVHLEEHVDQVADVVGGVQLAPRNWTLLQLKTIVLVLHDHLHRVYMHGPGV